MCFYSKIIMSNNVKKATTNEPPLSRPDEATSNLKTVAGFHPRENG